MTRAVFLMVLALSLGACAEGRDPTPVGPVETETPVAASPAASVERSSDSLEIEAFYAKVEKDLLSRGLLRADGGGPDTPFTDEMLARNFLAVAFSEEFSSAGGMIAARSRASTLHRWTGPIEISVVFGETVTAPEREEMRTLVDTYAARLSRVTGHPIGTNRASGNFTVFVLHDQSLRALGPELKARLPEISGVEIDFVQTLPLDAYCIVLTSDPDNTGRISRAVAVIRAELPRTLRTACIHEDVAQGLGLANDSDLARPSIFKDDDEFGRLTTHDEMLLSILYNSGLAPGMTEAEAAPLVRQLARVLKAPGT